jgi:nicotinamide phosphoribosyltransferase
MEAIFDESANKYYVFTRVNSGEEDRFEYTEIKECEAKGSVEVLWDQFGGTYTDKGYKVLNPRVGLIYGDSITLQRCQDILARLESKGFASSNTVFGVGSYSYQYLSRDSLGFAMKATWGQVNGEARELFKDPVTDNGTKRSARGLLRVERDGEDFVLYERQTRQQEQTGALQEVFRDGKMVREESLAQLRSRLRVGEA